MSMYHILLVFSACLPHYCFSERVSYNGEQVWRLFPSSAASSLALQDLLLYYSIDIWNADSTRIDFLVRKNLTTSLSKELLSHNVPFKVIIENVGSLIDKEQHILNARQSAATFTLTDYHPLEEIVGYLNSLTLETDKVSISEIGRTFENRSILLVKISAHNGTENKPVVWFDCCIHAREWVSLTTCLWGIDYLVYNYGNNSNVTNLLDIYDVYMVPVLNPDGYHYSWKKNRLWRKNRSRKEGSYCAGVDLNRNYDMGKFGGLGSSSKPCSDLYHGSAPFSEKETQAVRDKVTQLQNSTTVKAFFSIHSYGQLWLFAYGSKIHLPKHLKELKRVSKIGTDSIYAVNGLEYTSGPHFTAIYPASGTSVDWGYSMGIIHSYIVELRDEGRFGFLLPKEQIVPTASEAWEGFIQAILAI